MIDGKFHVDDINFKKQKSVFYSFSITAAMIFIYLVEHIFRIIIFFFSATGKDIKQFGAMITTTV